MASEAELTIDGLARAADTTVRSVRVYHERGILPPPQVRGRIGYYGHEHLVRLNTIGRLLSRGMRLNGIKDLLDAWDRGEGLAEVLGVADVAPTTSRRGLETITTPRVQALAIRLVAAGAPVNSVLDGVRRMEAACARLIAEQNSLITYLDRDQEAETAGAVTGAITELVEVATLCRLRSVAALPGAVLDGQ